MSEDKGLREVLAGQTLALSPKKQSAILGHAFNPASRIFSYLVVYCEKSWWLHPLHQIIWEEISTHHKKYGVCPSVEQLKESDNIARRDGGETNRIVGLLSSAQSDAMVFAPEPLRDEIEIWMHAKILQNAYNKGSTLWNQGKFADSQETIKSCLGQLNLAKFSDTFERKIVDRMEIAKELGPSSVVPFGIDIVDNHLFHGNPKGSLRKGDQTVVLAAVNTGKTTTLITVAMHNVRAGNHVLFVTHEGHRSDLRLKMIRCYLSMLDVCELRKIPGFDKPSEAQAEKIVKALHEVAGFELTTMVEFLSAPRHETVKSRELVLRKAFDDVLDYVQSHITFMPIHKAAMEVEDIMVHIEQAQVKWKETHKDADGNPKGYDLFVCDYPGVLTTRQNSKGNMAWRHVQETVYNHFVQAALVNEWHSLVAVQTNREGAKINSGNTKDHTHRFLTNEDVSECFGIIMSATTVITLNRSPAAQSASRLTYVITKTRNAKTGFAATCKTDFARSVSHSDALGAISYFGTSEQNVVIEANLRPGQRRFIPEAEMIAAMSGSYSSAGEK